MKNILYLLPLLILFWSCDEYTSLHQPFIENGEIIYTVKVDSVISFPGKNRINIKAGFASAPHIKKIKIEWDEGAGSQTWDVEGKNDTVFYEFMITDLDEKSYIFSLYTLDSDGNRSVRVDEFASVYGDKYEATLKNRSINELELNSDSVVFNWAVAPLGLIYTDLSYSTTEGASAAVRILADSSRTVLFDCSYTMPVTYKSSFLPEPLAIDTFFCADTEVDLSNYPYELGKDDWTVESYSSQVATQPVENAIDGDNNTYWESLSSADGQDYPHEFVIDMHNQVLISQFIAIRRTSNFDGPRVVQFLVSNDGSTWTDLGEHTFKYYYKDPQKYDVDTDGVSYRYFKFVAVSGGSKTFTNLGEISIFGAFDSN